MVDLKKLIKLISLYINSSLYLNNINKMDITYSFVCCNSGTNINVLTMRD